LRHNTPEVSNFLIEIHLNKKIKRHWRLQTGAPQHQSAGTVALWLIIFNPLNTEGILRKFQKVI
jgi:hypothetical protein